MVPLKDFLPDLLPYVVGCPEPVALRALRMAARRFCYDTWVVTVDSGSIAVPPGHVEIDLSSVVDTGLVPIGVVRMEMDGISTELLGRTGHGIRANEALTLTLPTPPKTATTFRGIVAVAPSLTSDVVPDDLAGRWRETVVAEAASSTAAIPGTAYSNTGVVQLCNDVYLRGVGDARTEANRLYGGFIRVRGKAFD